MNKDYFLEEVKLQFKEVGNNMYSLNCDFITDEIKNSSSEYIEEISLASLENGKFYFMFYNLSSKISNIEKFNPILLVDFIDINNTKMLFGLSFNFIPVSIRTTLFNTIINNNLDIIEKNNKYNLKNEYKLNGINLVNVYKLLQSIGFEWALRKFDIKFVNNIYNISTKILPKFITMSTHKFTGVDDKQLIIIWQKKIKEQQERHNKFIKELTYDYKNLNKTLNNEYESLKDQIVNLEETLKIIKKI